MKRLSNIQKRLHFGALILIIGVSACLTYKYFNSVERPNFEQRLDLHNQIIAGVAPSPYRYRILVPFMAEFLYKALSTILPAKPSFLLSYAIYDLFAISLLLIALFYWLRNWFKTEPALIGVLYVAGTMPVALQDHYFQPWSLIEVGFFTSALIAIYKGYHFLLTLIVILASLNRETAVVIPVAFLLANLEMTNLAGLRRKTAHTLDIRVILIASWLFCTWAGLYLGVRHFRGDAAQLHTIQELLFLNTTTGALIRTFINGSLFLGGFWVFAVLGLKDAPSFVRRASAIVPVYLILVILWGVWWEVRLLMPLYPIVIPLGLSFLYGPDPKSR